MYNFVYFSNLVHQAEAMSQKTCEMEESCKTLMENIDLLKRAQADIKNKINYSMKEMEQEHNAFKLKCDTLLK